MKVREVLVAATKLPKQSYTSIETFFLKACANAQMLKPRASAQKRKSLKKVLSSAHPRKLLKNVLSSDASLKAWNVLSIRAFAQASIKSSKPPIRRGRLGKF